MIEAPVANAGFSIQMVNCPGGPLHWSPETPVLSHGLIVVRSGMFRVRCDGREVLASPVTGLVLTAGCTISVAHPNGRDQYIFLTMPAELLSDAGCGAPGVVSFRVDGRLEFAHSLLRKAREESAAGEAEYLVRLLIGAARASAPLSRSGAAAAVAMAAQTAILADEPFSRGLDTLAGSLGVSPFWLSRAFAATAGTTITRYRNRVRVSRVLERLQAGERNLARLAGDLGFADQPHLTRAVKAEVGLSPGTLRKIIADVAGSRTTDGSSRTSTGPALAGR